MKLLKFIFAITLVSLVAISCKEVKDDADAAKDDVEQAADAVEETAAEAVDAPSDAEDTPSDAVHTPSDAVDAPNAGIEASSEGPLELAAEGTILNHVADTPVVYPGCEEGTAEEIRACSLKKFRFFLKTNFNQNLASDLDLSVNQYKIGSIVKIDQTGKASIVKISGPHELLEKEAIRVIDKLPLMTPATKDGKPVSVSFVLPVVFDVN